MRLIPLFLLLFSTQLLTAQQAKFENRVNLVFGLGQITQGGFNIEGNLFYNRFVFDYSHGVTLSVTNDQLEQGNDREQGLDIHLPWTTGFGVGYRFTDWLNLRLEPKWHKYALYYHETDYTSENLHLYTRLGPVRQLASLQASRQLFTWFYDCPEFPLVAKNLFLSRRQSIELLQYPKRKSRGA